MKPLECGYPSDDVVCLMPKPEINLANSLLWNGGQLLSHLDNLQLRKDQLEGPLMTRMKFLLCTERDSQYEVCLDSWCCVTFAGCGTL